MCTCPNAYECPHRCWFCSMDRGDGCEEWCHIRPFEGEDSMSTFKRGDTATHHGDKATVLHGPEEGNTGPRYMVRLHRSNAVVVSGDLEPIPPADERVDVVAKAVHAHYNPGNDWDDARMPEAHREAARAVLSALDAHSGERCKFGRCNEVAQCTRCDMDAAQPRRVRDNDGDAWMRQPNGTYAMHSDGSGELYTLNRLRSDYGPLTTLEN